MKILLTTTMALGFILTLGANQPTLARGGHIETGRSGGGFRHGDDYRRDEDRARVRDQFRGGYWGGDGGDVGAVGAVTEPEVIYGGPDYDNE